MSTSQLNANVNCLVRDKSISGTRVLSLTVDGRIAHDGTVDGSVDVGRRTRHHVVPHSQKAHAHPAGDGRHGDGAVLPLGLLRYVLLLKLVPDGVNSTKIIINLDYRSKIIICAQYYGRTITYALSSSKFVNRWSVEMYGIKVNYLFSYNCMDFSIQKYDRITYL